VPVVAGCLFVLGGGKRVRRRVCPGRTVVDPDFVQDERVAAPVCPSLKEKDVLQILRLESVNGCSMKFSERNPVLNPLPCGQNRRRIYPRGMAE